MFILVCVFICIYMCACVCFSVLVLWGCVTRQMDYCSLNEVHIHSDSVCLCLYVCVCVVYILHCADVHFQGLRSYSVS